MFTHMHHERMIFIFENAPEFAGKVPAEEWIAEPDPNRVAQTLAKSTKLVRTAVKGRMQAGRGMDLNFDHPIHLIQLLLFHQGYHHGQIKLALKLAGRPMSDRQAGPPTWDVWRRRK